MWCVARRRCLLVLQQRQWQQQQKRLSLLISLRTAASSSSGGSAAAASATTTTTTSGGAGARNTSASSSPLAAAEERSGGGRSGTSAGPGLAGLKAAARSPAQSQTQGPEGQASGTPGQQTPQAQLVQNEATGQANIVVNAPPVPEIPPLNVPAPAFDTHSFYRDMIKSGLTHEQAESVLRCVQDAAHRAQAATISMVATHDELMNLRAELNEKVFNSTLKFDISQRHTRELMQKDMTSLRADLQSLEKQDIAQLQNEIAEVEKRQLQRREADEQRLSDVRNEIASTEKRMVQYAAGGLFSLLTVGLAAMRLFGTGTSSGTGSGGGGGGGSGGSHSTGGGSGGAHHHHHHDPHHGSPRRIQQFAPLPSVHPGAPLPPATASSMYTAHESPHDPHHHRQQHQLTQHGLVNTHPVAVVAGASPVSHSALEPTDVAQGDFASPVEEEEQRRWGAVHHTSYGADDELECLTQLATARPARSSSSAPSL